MPGSEALHYLRNVEDADRLVASMDTAAASSAPAVVLGGGYIGTEVAAALVNRGMKVRSVISRALT